jgi:phosphonate transport system substrate-binding protein
VITWASFLGDNARPTYEQIVAYASAPAGIPTRYAGDVEWARRHEMLDQGLIDLAFICGLPYTEKHDRPDCPVELLAAPVMGAERYQGRPVYFTDVVVRSDGPLHSFADLRGRSWAFNGVDSNSGYNIPRDHLLALGETAGYFGCTAHSGSHQKSVQMVLDGLADASGIDSIVFELECNLRPEVSRRLRVIESLGPHPVPPVVVSKSLPGKTKAALGRAFLGMHEDAEGRRILAEGLIARFVAVDDAYYDPIRDMARRAVNAGFLELK